VTAAPPGDPAHPDDDVSVTLSGGHYDSFVLRVFSRVRDGELVHGEVTHVATRRKERFTDLRSALAFIVATIAHHPSRPDTGEHD
jgi:hypothetical protein